MQPAGAPKADESEIARIVAAFDGDHAKSALHSGIRNGDNSSREIEGGLQPHAILSAVERAMQEIGEIAFGLMNIQPEGATQEVIRVEPAQYQMGVCDRRSRATAAVADGPGCGAGAFRSYPQGSCGIEPSQ